MQLEDGMVLRATRSSADLHITVAQKYKVELDRGARPLPEPRYFIWNNIGTKTWLTPTIVLLAFEQVNTPRAGESAEQTAARNPDARARSRGELMMDARVRGSLPPRLRILVPHQFRALRA